MSEPARAVLGMRPADDRLNSWKEIAAYLARGTRTVQRWEREENLPVHRLIHQKQSSVYAFRSELDTWWNDRRARLEEEPAAPTPAPDETPPVAIEPGRTASRRTLRWGAAAIVAVVIALAAAIRFWPQGPLPPQPTWKVGPLTSYPGYESWPSFSPDGKQVAFSWSGPEDRPWDIYVKLVGADQPLRLVSDNHRKYSPVWSPDGTRIAFIRDLGDARSEIATVPALGGPESRIADMRNEWVGWFDGLLAWSADSKWLISVDMAPTGEPSSLAAIPVAGGDRRRLTSPPALALGDSSPAVSPDGKTLAFVRCSTMQVCDIYVQALSLDLGPVKEPKRLTSQNSAILAPLWAAGGREILYPRREGSAVNLWRVPAGGGQPPLKVASIGTIGHRAAISRRGDRLAWVQGQADQDIFRVDLAQLAVGSAKPVKVAASTHREFDAEISPDGRFLTFISERSGSREVWRSDADGSNPIQLTSFGGAMVSTPRWSPDGRLIAFDARANANGDIYAVPSGGGQARRVTEEPSDDAFPAWSGDGRWLYFASDRGGSAQIWKKPALGGAAVQLTRRGGIAPTESLDGRFVYYMQAHSGDKYALWRVPAGGGEEEQVAAPRLGLQKFAPTTRGVYFIEGDWRGTDLSLMFQPFTSRRPETAGKFRQRLDTGLSLWPPDRPKWLFYSGYEKPTADLVMAEMSG